CPAPVPRARGHGPLAPARPTEEPAATSAVRLGPGQPCSRRLELPLEALALPAELEVSPLRELDRVPGAVDGLPAAGRMMGGNGVRELARARLVEELRRQTRDLRIVLEELVEEARSRPVLVDPVVLAGPQLLQRPVDDRVFRGRADEGVVDPAVRLQRGGHEVGSLQVRVERTVTFEVGVDVDPAPAPAHVVPEDVRALSR